MIEKRTLKISSIDMRRLDAALNWKDGDDPSLRLGEDTTISYTAYFDNGYEVDMKICGVRYEEGSNNSAWTEAVLFLNGAEIACTEVNDDLLGEWTFTICDKTFVVIVEEDKEEET